MATNWTEKFMDYAEQVAEESNFRDRHIGAVIYDLDTHAVIGSGANTLVRGLNPDEKDWYDDPFKEHAFEHAERNAIYWVARFKTHVLNRKGMAVNWFPCVDCVRAIIQCGLIEVIVPKPDWMDTKWGTDWVTAHILLQAAGIRIVYLERQPQELRKAPDSVEYSETSHVDETAS